MAGSRYRCVALAACLAGSSAGASPRALFVNYGSDQLSILTIPAHETTTVTVGETPFGAAARRDGLRAWVTNLGDGTVSVVEVSAGEPVTATVSETISLGGFVRGVAATPDGAKVFVTHDDGNLSVIDGNDNSFDTLQIQGGGFMPFIVMNQAGTKAYAGMTDFSSGLHLLVFDAATEALVANSLVSALAMSVSGIAVNPAGTRVYLVAYDQPKVFVVDTVDNLVDPGLELECSTPCQPFGVTVSSDGATVYVSDASTSAVRVFDVATRTELAPFDAGASPTGLDVTPDGGTLYVLNQGDDSISVIDTSTGQPSGPLYAIGDGVGGLGDFIVPGPTTTTTTTVTTTTASTTTTTLFVPPVFGATPLRCQQAIAGSYKRFGAKAHGLFAGCLSRLLRDGVDASGIDACRRALDPTNPTSSLARARASASTKLLASCAGVLPVQLGRPCDMNAIDVNAITVCVLDAQLDRVAATIAAEYAHACGLMGEVGLLFPALCPGG
jgi:DNA-binding beta-propeller fold protein YncE